MKSDFEIILSNWCYVVIRDKCTPGFASVTNAAEYTIQALSKKVDLRNKKVFYLDSMKNFDELVHNGIEFVGFKAPPENIKRRLSWVFGIE